ncbi:MAG: transcriptional regulator [Rhodobacteraceae bacterium]|nr:transcriptional regulator [Paracoccaceae bacterium]
MRVATRTNLAARVLMFSAVHTQRLVTTAEIAHACNCSSHHLAHVVQRLQSNGYISTVRGRSGGLCLARPKDQISVGAIFRLFEGDIPIAECFDDKSNACPLVKDCRLRNYILRAQEAFYHELDMVTLDDLVRGNCGLVDLLTMQPAPAGRCKSASSGGSAR